MKRRRAPAPASAGARRGPAGAAGGTGAAREDRLLGLGRALGNRAMGSLLAEGAASRGRRSRSGLAAGKLDEWLERALRDAGVGDPDQRARLRPRLREAIESGAEGAVDEVMEAADLEPAVEERLERELATLPEEH